MEKKTQKKLNIKLISQTTLIIASAVILIYKYKDFLIPLVKTNLWIIPILLLTLAFFEDELKNVKLYQYEH